MEKLLTLLIHSMKEKKELSLLSDPFISKKITEFLRRNQKIKKSLQKKIEKSGTGKIARSKEYELIIKSVRKDLREVYGMFILDSYTKKEAHDAKSIQKSHRSTKEREPYVRFIYREMLKRLPNHDKIQLVDLGCGMNPATAPLFQELAKVPCEFYPFDLSDNDIQFINQFFKLQRIKGKAIAIDLSEEENFSSIRIPKRKALRVCLMLKLLDTLETQNRHISKRLLSYLKGKMDVLVVSFPLLGISGKRNITPEKRSWFEKFLDKENLKHEEFEIGDEHFYLIRT